MTTQDWGDAAARPGLSPSVEPLRVSPADAASIPIATPRGYRLSELFPLLGEIATGDMDRWTWCRNTQCKYVTLMIDTRDGGYVALCDRDGRPISYEDLARQYRPAQGIETEGRDRASGLGAKPESPVAEGDASQSGGG